MAQLTSRGQSKYWFNGRPFPGADHTNNSGTQKYWFNGMPVPYIYAAGASYSYTMTGGGLCGGAVNYSRLVQFPASGGGLAGGISNYNRTVSTIMAGGSIAGGTLTSSQLRNIVMQGGGISGGSANYWFSGTLAGSQNIMLMGVG